MRDNLDRLRLNHTVGVYRQAVNLEHSLESRHLAVPTFTDLLKFKLIFNVKDFSSPIQEGKREE